MGGSTNFFILRFGSRFSSVVCARSGSPSQRAARARGVQSFPTFAKFLGKLFPNLLQFFQLCGTIVVRGGIREYIKRALLSTARLKAVKGIVSGAFSKSRYFRKRVPFFRPSLTFIYTRHRLCPRGERMTAHTAQRDIRR